MATNVLARPLKEQRLRTRHLLEVQLRRELPIRALQFLQALAQKQVIGRALDSSRPFGLPLSLRLPLLNRVAVLVGAFGVWPVRPNLGLIAELESRC